MKVLKQLPQAWQELLVRSRTELNERGYDLGSSSEARAFLGEAFPGSKPSFPCVYGWLLAEQAWQQWQEPEICRLFLRNDRVFKAGELFLIGDTDPDYPFAINLKEPDGLVWYLDQRDFTWSPSALCVDDLARRLQVDDWS